MFASRRRGELDTILSQIEAQGLSDIQFRIGAKREIGSDDYYWVDDTGALMRGKINDPSHWLRSMWGDGEPSFAWQTTQEDVLELYHDPTADRWTLNDIPDLGYPGSHYGYIVEYP